MTKNVINCSTAPAPIGPYNQAIMTETTLYVSGQIAIDQSTGNMVIDEIGKETEQVMKNLGEILKEAEMSYKNIVKCSIFIIDMNNFSAINEIYGSYFEDDAPARETVEVNGLPKGVNVEISCIAVR